MPSHKNKGKQQASAEVATAGDEDVIAFSTPDKDVQWAQTFFTADGATDEDAPLPPADVSVSVPAAAPPAAASPAAPPAPTISQAPAAPPAAHQEEIRLLRQQLEQQSALIQMLLNQQKVAPVQPVAPPPPPAQEAPRPVVGSAPPTPTNSRGQASAFRRSVPKLPDQVPHVDSLARLRNSTAKTSTGSLRQKDVHGKRTPSVISFRDEIKLGSTYTTKGFGGLV
jgi:hypothetical protein